MGRREARNVDVIEVFLHRRGKDGYFSASKYVLVAKQLEKNSLISY